MSDVFGVRVTAELEITDSLIIVCNNLSGQTEPVVTFADEYFFVAWLDGAFETRIPVIKVARVDTQGTVLDMGITIDSGDEHPDIAFDGSRCLVTWCEEFSGVKGRFVNAACQPEGQTIEIATTQGTSTAPVVEYGTPHYIVVWPDFCPLGTDLDIYGQIVSIDGQLVGDRIQIADGPAIQNYVAAAFDGNEFLVVWVEDADHVYGRFISVNGVPNGPKFLISDNSSYERQHPSVHAGPNSFLIAWNEYHDDFDIYGNLDILTGIDELNVEIPKGGFTMSSSQVRKYLDLNTRLYDALGRRITKGPIAPGIYFLETKKKELTKVVVIR
ncbi:hypothetical protein AMJ87_00390 [candidate division WOR_3 bacterium SM23_60]|uniref:T9SS type A sorting domain-containing protein n=1 Tax=candidate division WOR_3 bacterium SM23_60 TaxID=1703780 RepID=A0A0S8GME5_UNCW3|nr:MAG: hypothetical protein AMJ87_00390 [candidate division WOR_3 bacterium SM23_60]